jgi:hypothetical protein
MRSFVLLPIALLLLPSLAHAQVVEPAPMPAPAPSPPPAVLAGQWHPGTPPPPGYHVEERPRTGLVIAGTIVAGVPYFFSVVAAGAAQSNNASGDLYIPVAGPWLTMGQRRYGCNPDQTNSTTGQNLQCVADIFVVMGLIADGVMQATGATLLIVGLTATKSELVRDDQAVHFAPMQVGHGYGAGVFGRF